MMKLNVKLVNKYFYLYHRALKYPLSAHLSYKSGFAVSFLLLVVIVISHTPIYLTSRVSYNKVCYVDFSTLSSFTEKLYNLSFDVETGIHTDVWNRTLVMIPITLVGGVLPVLLIGIFYYKATKAMNAYLRELAEKIEKDIPQKTDEMSSKEQSDPKETNDRNKPKERKKVQYKSNAILRRQRENKAVAKLMMYITILTSVFYLPTLILDWVPIVFPKILYDKMADFEKAAALLAYTPIFQSSASPLFYAGMHKDVKRIAKRIFCRR